MVKELYDLIGAMVVKRTQKGLMASGIMLHEDFWISLIVGYIAPSTPGNAHLSEHLRSAFQNRYAVTHSVRFQGLCRVNGRVIARGTSPHYGDIPPQRSRSGKLVNSPSTPAAFIA